MQCEKIEIDLKFRLITAKLHRDINAQEKCYDGKPKLHKSLLIDFYDLHTHTLYFIESVAFF